MFSNRKRAAARVAHVQYMEDVKRYGVAAADAMATARALDAMSAATAQLTADTAAALDAGRAGYSSLERPAAGWAR